VITLSIHNISVILLLFNLLDLLEDHVLVGDTFVLPIGFVESIFLDRHFEIMLNLGHFFLLKLH